MTAHIIYYKTTRYAHDRKVSFEERFDNIQGYEVVAGEMATKIGLETDEASRDEYNEYLLLHLENGETITYCNSHCDLFLI